MALMSSRGSRNGAGGLAGSLISAIAVPSATGGALRVVAATLMLFSISARARASRALAVRPPNTTAMIWRLLRRTEVTILKPES